jgi:hypothetical protein
VAVLLAVGFVAMQCRYPAHTNPAFSPGQTMETMIATPPDVHAILRRACADCHSDETNWPWYSYVAPTSWFVVGHVNHGRRFINMSTWVRPGKEPVDSIDRLKAMHRSGEGRDAAHFLQTGALACVAFRRRCSAGLRMVGGRTKALKHGAPMRKHFQRRRDE